MQEITLAAAAQILSLSPDRVRKLARSGRLPAVKVAGAWFFRPEDVEIFKAIRRNAGRPKKPSIP